MRKVVIQSQAPQDTVAIAKMLGEKLLGGEVFALEGDLGAGKTCFVQGLAQGLEVPSTVYVRSPTFTLMDSYPGRHTLHHLDLYRLGDLDELEAIGWRDCLDGDAVVAVEWAQRLDDFLPDTHLVLQIEGEDESRTLTFSAHGSPPEWWDEWCAWTRKQSEEKA